MLKKVYHVLIFFTTICAITTFAGTDSLYLSRTIEVALEQYYSHFIEISNNEILRRKEVAPATAFFKKELLKNDAVDVFYRSNSKGILVNEVCRKEISHKVFRDVSNNLWYSKSASKRVTFIGDIERKDKNYISYWSMPIFVERSDGTSRFAGVIAAKINVISLIKYNLVNYDGSFVFLDKKKILYSQDWDNSCSEYNDISIFLQGKEFFRVRTAISVEQAMPVVDIQNKIKSSKLDTIITDSNLQLSSDIAPDVKNGFGKIFLIILIVVVIIGTVIGLKKKWRILSFDSDEDKTAEEDVIIHEGVRATIEAEHTGRIRDQVIAEIKDEIHSSILKNESNAIAKTIRNELHNEIKQTILENESENIREQIEAKLRSSYLDQLTESIYIEVVQENSDKIRSEQYEILKQQIRDNLDKEKKSAIENEFEKKLRDNIKVRIERERCHEFEKDAIEDLREEIYKRIKDENRADVKEIALVDAKTAIKKEIIDELGEALRDDALEEIIVEAKESVRANEYEALYHSEQEELRFEIRTDLHQNEYRLIENNERDKLSETIKQHIIDTQQEKMFVSVRDIVRKDAAEIIQNNEYDSIVDEEREKIRDSIHSKLLEKESIGIEVEEQENITGHINDQLRTKEVEKITIRMRAELEDLILTELENNEAVKIREELTKDMELHIKAQIEKEEFYSVKERIFQDMCEKERNHLMSHEKDKIIDKERHRIAREEYTTLRDIALSNIHDKEKIEIINNIKEEIYTETVDDLKLTIEENTRASLRNEMDLELEELESSVKADYQKRIMDEYHYLMGMVMNMDGALKNAEALDSLKNTIARMVEEKMKYKFFNLNADQTESFIEYMQRLHGNFDVYFNSLKQILSTVKIKLNGIKNDLDDNSQNS